MQRTHQAAEPLEGSRNPHMRVDLDENTLCGVDVDLQQARLVERRVEQRQQALRTPRPRHAQKNRPPREKQLKRRT